MSIHKRIEHAAANAPLIEAGPISSVNAFSSLADKDNEYAVQLNRVRLPDEPHEVSIHVDDAIGLRGLLVAFEEVTTVEIGQQRVKDLTRHENQHWAAAKLLGATSGFFGIRVFEAPSLFTQETALTCQPYFKQDNLITTKLGHALVIAHPLELSVGDVEDIAECGYSGGVEQLAAIATGRNVSRTSPNDQFYPVPLSWSGSGTSDRRRLQDRPQAIDFIDSTRFLEAPVATLIAPVNNTYV